MDSGKGGGEFEHARCRGPARGSLLGLHALGQEKRRQRRNELASYTGAKTLKGGNCLHCGGEPKRGNRESQGVFILRKFSWRTREWGGYPRLGGAQSRRN